jgi:dihydroxyacetone kinase-like protein
VLDAMRAGGPDLGVRLREAAARGARATVPMRATKGRASFLGERSVGHMDPGARSSEMIVEALSPFLDEQA